MSARYCRGGCGTSIHQWLLPPWMKMSRIGASDVLVVSVEVTSKRRMIGRAPCQSCLRAASARWTDCWVRSHVACSQNGSGTIRKMRSLATVPGAGGLPEEMSFSRLIGGSGGSGRDAMAGCGMGTGLAAAGGAGFGAAAAGTGLAGPLVGAVGALGGCVPLPLTAGFATGVAFTDGTTTGLAAGAGLVTFAALLAAGFGAGLAGAVRAAALALAAFARARVSALTSSSFFMDS